MGERVDALMHRMTGMVTYLDNIRRAETPDDEAAISIRFHRLLDAYAALLPEEPDPGHRSLAPALNDGHPTRLAVLMDLALGRRSARERLVALEAVALEARRRGGR